MKQNPFQRGFLAFALSASPGRVRPEFVFSRYRSSRQSASGRLFVRAKAFRAHSAWRRSRAMAAAPLSVLADADVALFCLYGSENGERLYSLTVGFVKRLLKNLCIYF